jgi:hippurate hydrolase
MTSIPADLEHHLIALRRDLHRHPELSGREEQTAARIAAELDALGISYRTGVGGTGIVADIPGPDGVPAVALRADMDALPLQEETGLPFASEVDGVMHACGHDGHVAIIVGAATLASRSADRPAPIRLLFQPAEETGEGAAAMIADGALDGVGMIFGGHLDRMHRPGTLVVTDGPVNASTDEFYIDLEGPGGHGARPHETVDPVLAGTAIVQSLQSLITRDRDPTRAGVLTVGVFTGGTAPNIIPTTTRIEGTLRAQHPEVRAQLQAGVRRVAELVAAAHRVRVRIDVREGTPPVVNVGEPLQLAHQVARDVVGPEAVEQLKTGNMGGEDFGFYLEAVPGCFIRIGAQPPGESFSAHSSRFWWDEGAIGVGAAFFDAVARAAGTVLASRGD